MKSKFILLIISITTSLATLAGPNSTEYFICNFTDTISYTEISELKNNGFEIFESDKDKHTVYVKAEYNSNFTILLKSKMKEIIMVDSNGNRVSILETVTEESPEFLKVFFNFI